jgi:hypothetical protein
MKDPKQLKLLEVCVGSIAKSKYFGYMQLKAKRKKTDIFRMKTEHRRLEKDSVGGETFMMFSIIRRLLTAISTTIHRLRRPAWLCN